MLIKENPLIRVIIVLLLCTAVLWLYPVHYKAGLRGMEQSGYETLAVAESLLHGRGFADPFAPLPTGPTAHVSPVYPALQALILSQTHSEASAWFAIQWCVTLVMVLQVCLLPWLAERMHLGFESGVVAAVIWLIAQVPREDAWEQNYSGLLMTVVAFFMYKGLTGTLERWQIIVAGLFWGLLILTCPVAILALMAWLVLLHRGRAVSHARKLVLLLVPLAMLAPWVIRNYEVFHKFVLVRDNLGLEMEVSNNPCATFSFELNRISGCYSEHHPNESMDQASAVRELGEIGYNKQRMSLAKSWIRENPSAFLKLTVQRSSAFWLPTALQSEQSAITQADPTHEHYSPMRDLIVSMASLAAVVGLVLLWKTNRAAATVLLVWLLTFPLVYYLTQYGERARIPIMWAILLSAGYAAAELGRRLVGLVPRPAEERSSVKVEGE